MVLSNFSKRNTEIGWAGGKILHHCTCCYRAYLGHNADTLCRERFVLDPDKIIKVLYDVLILEGDTPQRGVAQALAKRYLMSRGLHG